MNPLDWRGPEFLLFYLAFAVVTLAVLRWIRLARESRIQTGRRLTDPYEIAYLRGGSNEAITLAAVGLVDRKLLQVTDESRLVANAALSHLVSHPLEKAVINFFRTSGKATSCLMDPELGIKAVTFRQPLEDAGLLANDTVRSQRLQLFFVGVTLLWLTAGAKVAVALARGRTNVFILILMAVAAAVVAAMLLLTPRLTVAGERVLEDLKTLFGGLDSRYFRPHQDTAELMMLAAVFGMGAVSAAAFPHTQLFPRQVAGSGGSSSDSGSSGSSCGGSSCGSGCGGGGGGCGGCGS